MRECAHHIAALRTQDIQEISPGPFAFEDRFALISSRSYMIKGTGVCYSQRASHVRSLINDPRLDYWFNLLKWKTIF